MSKYVSSMSIYVIASIRILLESNYFMQTLTIKYVNQQLREAQLIYIYIVCLFVFRKWSFRD